KGLYPGKTHTPPEPVNFQDHLEWEVIHGLVVSLTKIKLPWNANNLRNYPNLGQDFHSLYPHKPHQPSITFF
ncbi:uncharacterized protein VP01_4432g1, partial [Puccinia sorghi]